MTARIPHNLSVSLKVGTWKKLSNMFETFD